MKNLKTLTLLGIILLAGTLSGCFWDKDSNNENSNNIENMVQEDSPVAKYYNGLIDITAKCLDSEQAISDTYNNPSSSIIDVQLSINKTLHQCIDASQEIQTYGGREGDFSLINGVTNVLGKTINYYSTFSKYLSYEENKSTEIDESVPEIDESVPEIDESEEDNSETSKENSAHILSNLSNELDVLKEELDSATNELKLIQEEFASVYGLTLKN